MNTLDETFSNISSKLDEYFLLLYVTGTRWSNSPRTNPCTIKDGLGCERKPSFNKYSAIKEN